MGYRKVYLTMDEEEDIARIKSMREKEGRPNTAYNAILKEGLAMVMGTELARKAQVRSAQEVVATSETVSDPNHSSNQIARRRRRRA